jgi:D-glycero-alpha-D-manno-heptose 1-phosphate guanylyltransferase
MEAIILAGGLGTRLRSVITDVPKPMAPVAGRPFLDYILYYLKNQGVTRVILAVGYKWEIIKELYDHPENTFGLEIEYSVETEPLGTGGAIFKAIELINDDDFFIINGDTSFEIPLPQLKQFAYNKNAQIAMALKVVDDSARYGSVELNDEGRVLTFVEKGANNSAEVKINGGIYFMQKSLVKQFNFPQKFSFEVDFLQQNMQTMLVYGEAFSSSFIDIGIPEDYYNAQELFKNVINKTI